MLVIELPICLWGLRPEVRPQSVKLPSAEEKAKFLGRTPVLKASRGLPMLTQSKDTYSSRPRLGRVQVSRTPSVVDTKQPVAALE